MLSRGEGYPSSPARSISVALFPDKENWPFFERVMTQVGQFEADAFVHCEKKGGGLCGPSVLPAPNEGGHLSLHRGELSSGCVALLPFSRTKKQDLSVPLLD